MKLYSALQIDEIGTKIAAKMKAILAKTDLLKTAAYKDVGTTAGKIPEFVGNAGMGGFGYGGSAKKLAAGADLDLLPRVNALYTGAKADGILNRPPDLVKFIFEYEFVLECVVGDGTSLSYGAYMQRLTLDAFLPGTTSVTNPVIFVRTRSYLGFSPWVRLTGKMYGVDVGGDVVGDDIEVNSIKAGLTSPKIAFKSVVREITYENASYKPDGVTPTRENAALGAFSIPSGVKEDKILIMQARVYSIPYGSSYLLQQSEQRFGGTYFKEIRRTAGFQMSVYTDEYIASGNAPAGVDSSYSANKLFTKPSYVELFIIYKVD